MGATLGRAGSWPACTGRVLMQSVIRLAPSLMLLLAPAALAQSVQELPLTSVRSWKCEFPSLAVADWAQNEPTPTLEQQAFSFHIDNVDVRAGNARMVGNAGSEDLFVLSRAGALHFLEITPTGNLNITTIFSAVAGAGTLKAVHSRHVLLFHPLPSQAYGYCRPWE